ncbi:hypothetical protein Tco_0813695 [Tanacetum coccineum]
MQGHQFPSQCYGFGSLVVVKYLLEKVSCLFGRFGVCFNETSNKNIRAREKDLRFYYFVNFKPFRGIRVVMCGIVYNLSAWDTGGVGGVTMMIVISYIGPHDIEYDHTGPHDTEYDNMRQHDTEYDHMGQHDTEYDHTGQDDTEYDNMRQHDIEYDHTGQHDTEYDNMGLCDTEYDNMCQHNTEYDHMGQHDTKYDNMAQHDTQYDNMGQKILNMTTRVNMILNMIT